MSRVPLQVGLGIFIVLAVVGCAARDPAGEPAPRVPRWYVCQRAPTPPVLDGKLDDDSWQAAAWSDDFVDIEGELRPPPYFRTRMKMLWDDAYLYIGAELEEPHLQASLTRRDAVIYQDNDFEVFLDPDGDALDYYEIEVNALGTEWDLMLNRPYRQGGKPDTSWNLEGLVYRCHLEGTLNEPAGEADRGWSVELAIPWSELEEHAAHRGAPRDGEHWRINFSRVQWRWDIKDGQYVKRLDEAGQKLPEHNWVWSPQGVVSMHIPQMWGFVQFSTTAVRRAP